MNLTTSTFCMPSPISSGTLSPVITKKVGASNQYPLDKLELLKVWSKGGRGMRVSADASGAVNNSTISMMEHIPNKNIEFRDFLRLFIFIFFLLFYGCFLGTESYGFLKTSISCGGARVCKSLVLFIERLVGRLVRLRYLPYPDFHELLCDNDFIKCVFLEAKGSTLDKYTLRRCKTTGRRHEAIVFPFASNFLSLMER